MKRLVLAFAVAVGLPAVAASDPLAAALDAVRAGRLAEAAVIYRDLAQAGDGRAQFNLGLLFLTGRGVPQSHAEALYWAWRARLSGLREAPALLTRMEPLATEELRATLAARIVADLTSRIDAGEGRAMLEMAGVMIELLPEPDVETAFVWQSLAAALDVTGAAEARDATGAALDPEARLAAEARAVALLAELCGKGLHGSALCRTMPHHAEQGAMASH
jgi:uncharacterized protein